MECVCFTLIVDDIVLPHGEAVMEVLGGGGPQTLFGYQLVTNQTATVGLSAGVGPDLPSRCKDWLASISADTSGLVPWQRPTPRAWQVFEEWGRRTQIWRGRDDPCDELYDMLRPQYDTMPAHLQRSSNYHLGVHPLHPPRRLMRRLRRAAHAHGGVLSIEPYTAAEEAPQPGQVTQLLALCDIFSPNEAEAEAMVGPGSPEELSRRLLALSPPGGADVVVVRCGPQGVLVARRRRWRVGGPGADGAGSEAGGPTEAAGEDEVEVEAYAVPAVADTRVVDVTGCGNAFCGGFLAALYRGAACRTSLGGPGGPDRTASTSSPATGLSTAGAGADAGTPTTSGDEVCGDSDSGDDKPGWLGSSDVAAAAVWGCVAASFMAEERGVPMTPISQLQGRAQDRFLALAPRVRPVELIARAGRRQAVKAQAIPMRLAAPRSSTVPARGLAHWVHPTRPNVRLMVMY